MIVSILITCPEPDVPIALAISWRELNMFSTVFIEPIQNKYFFLFFAK